jgi:hypothetical protein
MFSGSVSAPVASGWALKLQSLILTQSPLGPAIRRHLLNSNGLHVLRELASQIPTLPPLHFPMKRLSGEAWATHADSASKGALALAEAFGAGDANEPTAEEELFGASRTMEYRKAFLSGASTPTIVAERTLKALFGGGGVEGLQARYRPFASLLPEEVRRQAAESTARYAAKKSLGVLDGIPVAIKDMIEVWKLCVVGLRKKIIHCGLFVAKVSGHVMRDGSAAHEDRPRSESDDPIVARLRGLGAVILGTTTMTEGGVTPLGYCVAEKVRVTCAHITCAHITCAHVTCAHVGCAE